MTRPFRIQLKRTKGWRMPAGAVKVDRSTKWGNPFKVDGTRMSNGDREVFLCGRFAGPPVGYYPTKKAALAAAVRLHRERLLSDHGALLRRQARAELKGRDLACWCALDGPCHADVLLEVANADATP